MLLVIVYFTVSYMIPTWTDEKKHYPKRCYDYPSISGAVNAFAWYVLGSWVLTKCIFQFVVWNRARRGRMEDVLKVTKAYALIESFWMFLVVPGWAYYGIYPFANLDTDVCTGGWMTLDLVNMIILYLYSFSFAMTTALLLPFVLCICVCCPENIASMIRANQP